MAKVFFGWVYFYKFTGGLGRMDPGFNVLDPIIRTTGFLGILKRGLTQFKFVYLTNDNDSHCDRSI